MLARKHGGGYDESVNSASYSVSDISYAGDAKAGDRLGISKIQITLTCVDASNSIQTYYYNPKEAYDHLKQKGASFSLTIMADGGRVVSFGGGDENFPEAYNPFTFDAGTTTISISGEIGGNVISKSCDISVEGNSQGGGNENPPITNPEEPEKPNERAESYEALLKMILGEEKYNEIKANLESNLGGDGLSRHLVLTAALIKEVGEKYPAIMASDEHDETVKKYAEGFVAQSLGMISVTKETCNYHERTYYKITFADDTSLEVGAETFDLGEIEIANNGKINFTEATFTGSNLTVGEINAARGDSLPKLSGITVNESYDFEEDGKEIYKLYKAYEDKNYLQGIDDISGDFDNTYIDGKKISGDANYTLFKSDNEEKTFDDTTIKSLSADSIIKMSNQLNVNGIYNMIISGIPSQESTIDLEFGNIIFEGDMSKVTNTSISIKCMYGIVYFKDMPYESYMQYIYGMLKLDKLSNSINLIVTVNGKMSVIDVRNVEMNSMIQYRGGIIGSGNINSVYFSKDHELIADVYKKFYSNSVYVNNMYYGEERKSGLGFTVSSGAYNPSSKTPRSLKGFEKLGFSYTDNEYHESKMKFETSAYDSYNGDFTGYEDDESKLKSDKDIKQLALNNKKIDFVGQFS